MNSQDRIFWQSFDPAWLAQHDANEKRIKLIQGAIDDLERAQAERDMAAMFGKNWDEERRQAEYDSECMRGEYESGWSFKNHE